MPQIPPFIQKAAEEIIPDLKDCIRTLKESASRIIAKPITRREDYLIVGHIFLGRLLGHMENLQNLHDSRDSFLIARSMLDGAMLFDWITLGPDAEARKQYVQDNFPFREIPDKDSRARKYLLETYRELILRCDYYETLAKADGQEEFPNLDIKRKECYAALLKNADDILTKQEKIDIEAGKPLHIERDFVKRFTGGRGWELFKLAGPEAKEVYDRSVNALAGYHHWNPIWLPVPEGGSWDEAGYVHVAQSDGPEDYRFALEIGFMALWLVAYYVARTAYIPDAQLLDSLRWVVTGIHTKAKERHPGLFEP